MLADKTLTILDTKNHEPHILPLSDFLYELLNECKQNQANDYVFPGIGVTGHIIKPRKQMAHVTKASGVEFTRSRLKTYVYHHCRKLRCAGSPPKAVK